MSGAVNARFDKLVFAPIRLHVLASGMIIAFFLQIPNRFLAFAIRALQRAMLFEIVHWSSNQLSVDLHLNNVPPDIIPCQVEGYTKQGFEEF